MQHKMKCSYELLFLVLLFSCNVSASSAPDNKAPGQAAQVTKEILLKGTISIDDLAAQIPEPAWEAKVLPSLLVGAKLLGISEIAPDGLWYKIPDWLAGTWKADYDEANQYRKSSSEKLGRVKDSKGEIWNYSRGFITTRPWKEEDDDSCTVINIVGGDVPLLNSDGSFTTIHRYIAVSHRSDRSIIRALVTVQREKYVQLSDGKVRQECEMTHLLNQGFEGVEPKSKWTKTFAREAPFEQEDALLDEFGKFLKSHNMIDLIPSRR